MAFTEPAFQTLKADLAKLTAPGILGFATHFEVTEIFACKDKDSGPPLNVLTIMVAEERPPGPNEKPVCLGQRIRLSSLKGWFFGIQRSLKQLQEIEQTLDHYHATGEWKPSGERLLVGELIAGSAQFVPPDSTTIIPFNCVLKNNFWNGSHVIECVDTGKTSLQPFLDDPRRLQELSTFIQKVVPIRLASLSDRLGNVVVQVPVTVLSCRFQRNQVNGDCMVDLQWHPKATARVLRGSCEMQFDEQISGYASAEIQALQATIPVGAGEGMRREILWDDQYQVVLAGTGGTSYIKAIAINMRSIDPEPRTFVFKDDQGLEVPVRIQVTSSHKSLVGDSRADSGSEWANRRLYQDEVARLAASRNFIQYKPEASRQAAEHEKALQDIRYLLNLHGEDGAWLWDPFLSGVDVLKTLFYCGHSQADLRALTAAQKAPASPHGSTSAFLRDRIRAWWRRIRGDQKPQTYAEIQRNAIEAGKPNCRGLRLEYRMKVGPAGWAFHDRFLIFPRKDGGALVWSLGTSVNALGKQHHILQKVGDGQMVAEAFSELWEALNGPEHLIWKTK